MNINFISGISKVVNHDIKNVSFSKLPDIPNCQKKHTEKKAESKQ